VTVVASEERHYGVVRMY